MLFFTWAHNVRIFLTFLSLRDSFSSFPRERQRDRGFAAVIILINNISIITVVVAVNSIKPEVIPSLSFCNLYFPFFYFLKKFHILFYTHTYIYIIWLLILCFHLYFIQFFRGLQKFVRFVYINKVFVLATQSFRLSIQGWSHRWGSSWRNLHCTSLMLRTRRIIKLWPSQMPSSRLPWSSIFSYSLCFRIIYLNYVFTGLGFNSFFSPFWEAPLLCLKSTY